jgi:hypothetical protein
MTGITRVSAHTAVYEPSFRVYSALIGVYGLRVIGVLLYSRSGAPHLSCAVETKQFVPKGNDLTAPSLYMRENTERWMELCAKAAVEQDPEKLVALVNEILALLEQKERRLGILPAKTDVKAP